MGIIHGNTTITVVTHGSTNITAVYHGSTKVFPDSSYQNLLTQCSSYWDQDIEDYVATIYLSNPNSFAVTINFDYIYVNHSTGDWETTTFGSRTLGANSNMGIMLYHSYGAEIYDFYVEMTMSGGGYTWGQDDAWSN